MITTTDILKADETNRRKAARKKYVSYGIARGLMQAAPDSPLYKSYRNTLYCKQVIVSDGDKTHSKYCKNRWCPVCNSIRTAALINAYKDAMARMRDMYFMAVTLPTCTADELPDQIARMQQAWQAIRHSKHWRALRPSGLKKEECTLRPRELYHFHYHFLVDSKEAALYLRSEWLRRFPEARPAAQKVKKVRNRDTFPLELFKYITKLGVEDKTEGGLDFRRLDVVMCALAGRRTFQPFGDFHASAVDEEQAFEELEGQADEMPGVWHWRGCDWVEIRTGELYSGWQPTGTVSEMFADLARDKEAEPDPPPPPPPD